MGARNYRMAEQPLLSNAAISISKQAACNYIELAAATVRAIAVKRRLY